MLTFNLKKEWFEKIKSGEKTHEYRELKPYWIKRIEKINLLTYSSPNICFKCGYPKASETDKILYGMIYNISIHNGLNTDLFVDEQVIDIEFKLIKEGWEVNV